MSAGIPAGNGCSSSETLECSPLVGSAFSGGLRGGRWVDSARFGSLHSVDPMEPPVVRGVLEFDEIVEHFNG